MSDSGVRIKSVPGRRRFHFDFRRFGNVSDNGALSLVQIGDSVCDYGFFLGPHEQECYEISYVVSGQGWFAANGQRVDMRPGDLHVCKPGDIHEGGVNPADPFRYLYLAFNFNASVGGNLYREIRDFIHTVKITHCRDRLDVRTPFMNALQELSGTSSYSKEMLRMYIEQILVLTYRNFSNWNVTYPGERLDDSKKRVVYSAIHYIDSRLLEIKDVAEIAAKLGYSVSYLSQLFQKEVGESLRNYFMSRKWQKATELLRTNKHSITQIAELMHYDSIHTFSRAFRRNFGLSPSQYVKEHMRDSSSN